MAIRCDQCPGLTFSRLTSLRRHERSVHDKPITSRFDCGYCGTGFFRKENLTRHSRDQHQAESRSFAACPTCGRNFRRDYLKKHKRGCVKKAIKAQIFKCDDQPPPQQRAIPKLQWQTSIVPQYSAQLSPPRSLNNTCHIGREARWDFMPNLFLGVTSLAKNDYSLKIWLRGLVELFAGKKTDLATDKIAHLLASGVTTGEIDFHTKSLCYEGLTEGSGGCSTFLEIAAWANNISAVQKLLQMGFNLSGPADYLSDAPLRAAVHSGHYDTVRLLVHSAPSPGFSKETIGFCAAAAVEKGHEHIVRLLLEQGTDPNEVLLASTHSVSTRRMTILLLEFGADLDSNEGKPLRHAFYLGNLSAVETLLEMGASARFSMHLTWREPLVPTCPSEIQEFGPKRSVLGLHAARQGIVVEWLSKYQAEEALAVKDVWTMFTHGNALVIDKAMSRISVLLANGLSTSEFDRLTSIVAKEDHGVAPEPRYPTILAIATANDCLRVARRLMEMGFADIYQRSTLWQRAVCLDNQEMMQFLLDSATDAVANMKELNQAISSAVTMENESAARFLLSRGVGANQALSVSCCRKSSKMLSLALEHNADLNTEHGKPLCTAIERGSAKVVEILLEAGAKTDLNVPDLEEAFRRAWAAYLSQSGSSHGIFELGDIISKTKLFRLYAERGGADVDWLRRLVNLAFRNLVLMHRS